MTVARRRGRTSLKRLRRRTQMVSRSAQRLLTMTHASDLARHLHILNRASLRLQLSNRDSNYLLIVKPIRNTTRLYRCNSNTMDLRICRSQDSTWGNSPVSTCNNSRASNMHRASNCPCKVVIQCPYRHICRCTSRLEFILLDRRQLIRTCKIKCRRCSLLCNSRQCSFRSQFTDTHHT